jgi:hypothetical protein
MIPLPADEPVAPIPTPAWGADLTVVDLRDEAVGPTVDASTAMPMARAALSAPVERLHQGWILALVAAALALAVALTVLALVTAHGGASGASGATPPASSSVVQVGSPS